MKFKLNSCHGFALLEVFLALIIIILSSSGIYALYTHSKNVINLNKVKQQIIQLTTTFNNLNSMNLTSEITSATDLITLFYDTQQIPGVYFKNKGTKLVNPYGPLSFSNISAQGFSITVPTGQIHKSAGEDLCHQLDVHVTTCTAQSDDKTHKISLKITVNAQD